MLASHCKQEGSKEGGSPSSDDTRLHMNESETVSSNFNAVVVGFPRCSLFLSRLMDFASRLSGSRWLSTSRIVCKIFRRTATSSRMNQPEVVGGIESDE